MAYMSGGKLMASKPWWTVDGMIDMFWAVINFCVLFLRTLVSPGISKDGNSHVTDYRRSGKAERGRRMGRIGGGGKSGGGGPSPPPMGGG
ncbi:Selenoprotein K [Geodia barretti]|uniref:Selenoprotein K n=1 Tax=Geodia barretti TaxID=519541 RepID=A0AA35WAD7_GEOBA|nr:Selenoprotein K [Geodia barretti]